MQVLTQAREHIIRKTFEALKGVKNAIVHVYNSTSLSQREQVFRKSKEEILQIAVEGAKLLQQLTEEAGADYRFEYSPESFTGTEPEYALEVCNAVLEVWKPTADRKVLNRYIFTKKNLHLSIPFRIERRRIYCPTRYHSHFAKYTHSPDTESSDSYILPFVTAGTPSASTLFLLYRRFGTAAPR